MYLSHQTARYREALPLLEEFLESSLPIRLIAHLTLPSSARGTVGLAHERWDDLLTLWTRRISADQHSQIGYIVGYERSPRQGIPLHAHVLLVAPKPLPPAAASSAWKSLVGASHETSIVVDDYRAGTGGASYAMKGADEEDVSCDVRYSNNLQLFSQNASAASGGNARQRRRLRLIRSNASSNGAMSPPTGRG